MNEAMKIVREECRHFEQVLKLMQKLNITFVQTPATGYAKALMNAYDAKSTDHFHYKLLCAAIIEARSCERFNALIPYLIATDQQTLASFYLKLYHAEKRHAEVYINWLERLSPTLNIKAICDQILIADHKFITQIDDVFGFHSGLPA